ncbi:transporter substrate-binding domain-containing protein [Limosilactobacillus difficilis]|uniref:transporter substrate-binding domain-containing protein n=1 Tax=Limosilactobacillus difficilis TaxID=2991838 RepID=UPI0024BB01B7|nr:transporter substrate-binding domain-containing protein [Limosilactobacillus difficilis]
MKHLKNHHLLLQISLLALVCLLTITGLSGCGHHDNSVSNIKKKGTLVMGTAAEADYAPFEFSIVKNKHQVIVGYDIMVAQKIAKHLGVKLKVQNMEFASLFTELQNHKVDMALAGITKTKQREKAVDFSKPYYKSKDVLMVRKADANKYNHPADANGKQIGVEKSSTEEMIAKKDLKAKLVNEQLTASLATDLKAGKLDGVVTSDTVADKYVAKYPNDYAIAKVHLKMPAELQDIDIALPKNQPALKKEVNEEIVHLQKTGQLKKMFKQAQKIQNENDK